jgi:hypothetical protein
MKTSPGLIAAFSLLVFSSSADDYRSELFTSLKPVYADDFDGGTLDAEHWQVRQGTTWAVKDGVLTGSPSPKEFQEERIAANDRAHAGFKPVIWLEKVPENLVAQFRLRFDGKDYQAKFPLLDFGHNINTLLFSREATTLVVKKDEKIVPAEEPLLPLNQWVDLTVELKKGVLLLVIDGKKWRFEDPLIDMTGQQQIDFKGIDHGGIQIDRVRIYEGIE